MGRQMIQDDLTDKIRSGELSKQRAYQIRQSRKGCCSICGGKPATSVMKNFARCAIHHLAHNVATREHQRKYHNRVRRNPNSPSYSGRLPE